MSSMRRRVLAVVAGAVATFLTVQPSLATKWLRCGPEFEFIQEAGGVARRVGDHDYELCDTVTGERSMTHGGDPVASQGVPAAGAHAPLIATGTDVECVVHNEGPQIVFLYGHWYPTAWRYDTVRPQLQQIVRRINNKLQVGARASNPSGSTYTPRLKTPCIFQNGQWLPWVGGFTNYPGSRSGSPDNTYQDIVDAVYDNYPPTGTGAAGGSPIKYVVFYDWNVPGYAGQGGTCHCSAGQWDDQKYGNIHAKQSGVAYTSVDYWQTNVPVHEMFHTLGAVQYTAPHSNWVAHCNDGADVMCYSEPGTAGVYPGPYDDFRCGYSEEGGYVPLDCKHDTYFNSSVSQSGYLANYWNLGVPSNPFFSFGNTSNVSTSANPTTLSIPPGGSGTSTITLASANNYQGTVTVSASGAPSGSTATVSPSARFVGAGSSATTTLRVTVGLTQLNSFTVTVTGCAVGRCTSRNVLVNIAPVIGPLA